MIGTGQSARLKSRPSKSVIAWSRREGKRILPRKRQTKAQNNLANNNLISRSSILLKMSLALLGCMIRSASCFEAIGSKIKHTAETRNAFVPHKAMLSNKPFNGKTGYSALHFTALSLAQDTLPCTPTSFGFMDDDLSECVIIDLRSPEVYARGHLPGSSNIPAGDLQNRMLELPPPFEEKLWMVGENKACIQDISKSLAGKGWNIDKELVLLPDGTAEGDLEEHYSLVTGTESAQSWRPTRFLRHVLNAHWPRLAPAAAAAAAGRAGGGGAGAPPPRPVALDLGCGNGRDALFLRQRLGPGWRVVGVDNHSHALDRGAELAKRCGFGPDSGLEWDNIDLRQPEILSTSSFAKASLVHGCRFLHRPLLEEIRDQVLLPDGIFIWSTFVECKENLAPPYRPSRILVSGELAEMFGDCDNFSIIYDEEGVLMTRTKPVKAQFFVAQKRLA